MAKLFCGFVGLVFIALGGYNLLFPVQGMLPFGLEINTVAALNEMRANYGGMHLVLGLFFLAGARRRQWTGTALLVIALFTGGLTIGRVLSLLVDGLPGAFIGGLLILESVACVIAWLLWRRDRQVAATADT